MPMKMNIFVKRKKSNVSSSAHGSAAPSIYSPILISSNRLDSSNMATTASQAASSRKLASPPIEHSGETACGTIQQQSPNSNNFFIISNDENNRANDNSEMFQSADDLCLQDFERSPRAFLRNEAKHPQVAPATLNRNVSRYATLPRNFLSAAPAAGSRRTYPVPAALPKIPSSFAVGEICHERQISESVADRQRRISGTNPLSHVGAQNDATSQLQIAAGLRSSLKEPHYLSSSHSSSPVDDLSADLPAYSTVRKPKKKVCFALDAIAEQMSINSPPGRLPATPKPTASIGVSTSFSRSSSQQQTIPEDCKAEEKSSPACPLATAECETGLADDIDENVSDISEDDAVSISTDKADYDFEQYVGRYIPQASAAGKSKPPGRAEKGQSQPVRKMLQPQNTTPQRAFPKTNPRFRLPYQSLLPWRRQQGLPNQRPVSMFVPQQQASSSRARDPPQHLLDCYEQFHSTYSSSSTSSSNQDYAAGQNDEFSRIIRGLKSFGIKGELYVSAQVNNGMMTVIIDETRNLPATPSGPYSCYARVSLIPDSERRTQCKTKFISASKPPLIFNETFSFELLPEDYNKRLLISAWHKNLTTHKSALLGCMAFSVRNLVQRSKQLEGWYFLLAPTVGRRKHLAVDKIKMTTYYGSIDSGLNNNGNKVYPYIL